MLVFVIASVAMAAVMGLQPVLQALQKYGLAPLEALKFLLLAMPTTLFAAVPIGGVLAATLVYGRLAFDNEINACRASGIHLGSLVWPGIVFGILSGVLNLVLLAWPIPASYYAIKVIARRDIERIFFEQLRSAGEVSYQGYTITVDHVEGDTLYGVTVSYQPSGEPRWFGVAPAARVRFSSSNKVRMILIGAQHWQEGGQGRGSGDQAFSFTIPTEIPREPLDLGFVELLAWQNDPDLSPEVQLLRERGDSPKSIDLARDKIRAETLAELHGRLGYCFTGIALVMLGIALSLTFEGSHFLVPFAVGIGPAIGTVIMTDLGKRLIAQHPGAPQDYFYLVWITAFFVLLVSVVLIIRQVRR